MTDQDRAPGWDAISHALDRLYPGVEPKHFGTLITWRLGGPDPLDGISVYPGDDHWHFVTYGMSDLYAKESENPETSGWGFEFTLRVTRTPAETEPPMWAANLLQNLARYVYTSGSAFGPGHHLNLNGPIALAQPNTAIRAITFAPDPELGPIDTPHGQLAFLQIVGLTLPEYTAIDRWNAEQLLELLGPHIPLLVTDPARDDLASEPTIAAAIETGTHRDGSSTASLYVGEISWRIKSGLVVLTIGALAADRVAYALAGRLPYGRDLVIDGPDGGVLIRPGEQLTATEPDPRLLDLVLPETVAAELATVLQPVAGRYRLRTTSDLIVKITKSKIRDQDGRVVQMVG